MRRFFSKLLAKISRGSETPRPQARQSRAQKFRSLLVESLEDRALLASDLGLASIVIPQAAPRINSLYQQQAHVENQASLIGLWTQARQSEPQNQLAHVFQVSAVEAANLVRDSYWTLLSEQPDPVASQFWQLQVQDGLPASQLKVAFLSSDEYFRQQGGDLGSWVSAVYRDALGRIPDQSDVAYWQDQVNNGLTLTGAAAAIVTSTEAEQLADQADQLRQLWHGDTQSSASPATHSGPVRNLVSASRIRYFSAPLSELETDAWMRFYVLARSS